MNRRVRPIFHSRHAASMKIQKQAHRKRNDQFQLRVLQAALAVMNRGLRPEIPSATPPPLTALTRACWAPAPASRPAFSDIVSSLEDIYSSVTNGGRGA